jgi:hypothetical protein
MAIYWNSRSGISKHLKMKSQSIPSSFFFAFKNSFVKDSLSGFLRPKNGKRFFI